MKEIINPVPIESMVPSLLPLIHLVFQL